MLVLSRKVGEELTYTLTQSMPAGTVIRMQIVEVRGDKVRIGTDADKSIHVWRTDPKEKETK